MQQEVARPFSEYIFLSKETVGKDGRRVFIDPVLLTTYLEFVEEDKLHGQQALQKMIGLKNSAAGISSQSNQTNAHQHRLDCHSVIITYSVLQSGAPSSFGEGVYISKIQQNLNRGEGNPGGLYNCNFERTRWIAKAANDLKISSPLGTIAASFNERALTYDLKSTTTAVGEYLAKNAKGNELGTNFALYYSPTNIIDNLGTWKTPEQKVTPESAGPEELSQVLINTQNEYWAQTDQTHHWYIFGHGAKLLEKALALVESKGIASLSHHEFSFVEPRSSLGSLLPRINRLQAKFNKNMSMKSLGARTFQALDLNATRRGLQLHSKSWTALENNLKPANTLLNNVNRAITHYAQNPAAISSNQAHNFVRLVSELKSRVNW